MKSRLAVVLAFVSSSALADIPGFQVEGSTMSWTATGWFQVQDTTSFQTVNDCEGRITSCTVEPGTYNVINHSSGDRQEFVVVTADTAPSQPIPTPAGQSLVFTRVERTCEYYIGGPDTNLGPHPEQLCVVSCPAGEVAVGGGCKGENRSLFVVTSALARQSTPKFDISGFLEVDGYSCGTATASISNRELANADLFNNGQVETSITASVMCLSQ